MKKKVIEVKLTKEEYKKLKKNAKFVYLSPKKYMKILASSDSMNGIVIPTHFSNSVPNDFTGITITSSGDYVITDTGVFLQRLISCKLAKDRAKKYRRNKKSSGRRANNGKRKERK